MKVKVIFALETLGNVWSFDWMTKMSRKYTLKEVGSGYRRGGWIDKQYPKEFQRVAPLVQETQYVLPWKQVGTLSFLLKAWNSVGFTDLFLKSHKECEFYANVSNIFQLFQHLRNFLILQKDETIFCKKKFRFHHSLLIVICLLRLSVLRLRFHLSSLICPPVPTYLHLLHHHCSPL